MCRHRTATLWCEPTFLDCICSLVQAPLRFCDHLVGASDGKVARVDADSDDDGDGNMLVVMMAVVVAVAVAGVGAAGVVVIRARTRRMMRVARITMLLLTMTVIVMATFISRSRFGKLFNSKVSTCGKAVAFPGNSGDPCRCWHPNTVLSMIF